MKNNYCLLFKVKSYRKTENPPQSPHPQGKLLIAHPPQAYCYISIYTTYTHFKNKNEIM